MPWELAEEPSGTQLHVIFGCRAHDDIIGCAVYYANRDREACQVALLTNNIVLRIKAAAQDVACTTAGEKGMCYFLCSLLVK